MPSRRTWGNPCTGPRGFLDLGTRWRWVVSVTARPHFTSPININRHISFSISLSPLVLFSLHFLSFLASFLIKNRRFNAFFCRRFVVRSIMKMPLLESRRDLSLRRGTGVSICEGELLAGLNIGCLWCKTSVFWLVSICVSVELTVSIFSDNPEDWDSKFFRIYKSPELLAVGKSYRK
jgi:hypothetical protein